MRIILTGGWRGHFELRLKRLAENQNLALILMPVRNFVWMAVAVRNFLNPRGQFCANIPVISVGNITVGGTGKTPFVRWLAQRLIKLGFKPAILTPLSEGADEVREHTDENLSKPKSCLVFPGRDRVANAKQAIEQGASVIVLDDGFQFRSLHRDVDIVLWDATWQPFANDPFLREPLGNLKRATCIVISKADALGDEEMEKLKQQIEKWAGEGKVVAAFGYEPVKANLIAGNKVRESKISQVSRVLLVAGIANPSYFSVTAQRAGFRTVAMVCFPDHHRYKPSDEKFIAKIADAEGADGVLTTYKDAVKLHKLWQSEIPLLALEVKLHWLWGESRLWEIVEKAILKKQPKSVFSD